MNSPFSASINSYMEKVKNERATAIITKTYSPKNTYALLDFLIHASAAQQSIYVLKKMPIYKIEAIGIELRKFDKIFSTLDADFKIMQKQDDDELGLIMDMTDELGTNIAFFNMLNNSEFINVVNDYSINKNEIGKVVDKINQENDYNYFQISLSDKHREVKNICELIVHLTFVIYWSDKFVNISGYNPIQIKEYTQNLINLLEPHAALGLSTEFSMEYPSGLASYYLSTCKSFFNTNTSSKIEFMKLFKAYNSNSRELLLTISNIKLKSKMEQISKLAELTAQAQIEANSFYNKGNKAAGTRLRKIMMEIKNLTGEVRRKVSDTKNS